MSVSITTVTCTSASGSFVDPTTAVTDCYFQGQDGSKFHAVTINNNDPGTGDWNATNFASKPSPASYNVFAVGDSQAQNPFGGNPISC